MATYSRATVTAKALEAAGVKAAGVAAAAEDTDLGLDAFDTVYRQLRRLRRIDFANSATPEWALGPMIDIIAADLAPRAGVTGQRLQELAQAAERAQRQFIEQMSGAQHPVPVRFRNY